MMKLLPLTLAVATAFSPYLIKPVFGQSISTQQFPRVTNPAVNEPLCFVETSSGSTLNLTALCGRPTPITAPAAAAPPSNSPQTTPAAVAPNNSPAPTVTQSPNPGPRGATAEEKELGIERPQLNLPRVPGSAFNPGGTAPTREAITGPRQ